MGPESIVLLGFLFVIAAGVVEVFSNNSGNGTALDNPVAMFIFFVITGFLFAIFVL